MVLWGQLADFATSYLGKGRLVYVEGRLQGRQWQACLLYTSLLQRELGGVDPVAGGVHRAAEVHLDV